MHWNPPGAIPPLSRICWECGADGELHDHHPVPRSRGGIRTIPLCLDCHAKAHHRGKAMTTSALTSAALRVKAKRGERVGAIPYGSRLDDDGIHLLPEPSERVVVALARELRADGLSLRAVSAELDARGYVARSGRPFLAPQVARMVARG